MSLRGPRKTTRFQERALGFEVFLRFVSHEIFLVFFGKTCVSPVCLAPTIQLPSLSMHIPAPAEGFSLKRALFRLSKVRILEKLFGMINPRALLFS